MYSYDRLTALEEGSQLEARHCISLSTDSAASADNGFKEALKGFLKQEGIISADIEDVEISTSPESGITWLLSTDQGKVTIAYRFGKGSARGKVTVVQNQSWFGMRGTGEAPHSYDAQLEEGVVHVYREVPYFDGLQVLDTRLTLSSSFPEDKPIKAVQAAARLSGEELSDAGASSLIEENPRKCALLLTDAFGSIILSGGEFPDDLSALSHYRVEAKLSRFSEEAAKWRENSHVPTDEELRRFFDGILLTICSGKEEMFHELAAAKINYASALTEDEIISGHAELLSAWTVSRMEATDEEKISYMKTGQLVPLSHTGFTSFAASIGGWGRAAELCAEVLIQFDRILARRNELIDEIMKNDAGRPLEDDEDEFGMDYDLDGFQSVDGFNSAVFDAPLFHAPEAFSYEAQKEADEKARKKADEKARRDRAEKELSSKYFAFEFRLKDLFASKQLMHALECVRKNIQENGKPLHLITMPAPARGEDVHISSTARKVTDTTARSLHLDRIPHSVDNTGFYTNQAWIKQIQTVYGELINNHIARTVFLGPSYFEEKQTKEQRNTWTGRGAEVDPGHAQVALGSIFREMEEKKKRDAQAARAGTAAANAFREYLGISPLPAVLHHYACEAEYYVSTHFKFDAPLCLATFTDDGTTEIRDLHHQEVIPGGTSVPNDYYSSRSVPITVASGAITSGKTTCGSAVALARLSAQQGRPVFATSAKVSIKSRIECSVQPDVDPLEGVSPTVQGAREIFGIFSSRRPVPAGELKPTFKWEEGRPGKSDAVESLEVLGVSPDQIEARENDDMFAFVDEPYRGAGHEEEDLARKLFADICGRKNPPEVFITSHEHGPIADLRDPRVRFITFPVRIIRNGDS